MDNWCECGNLCIEYLFTGCEVCGNKICKQCFDVKPVCDGCSDIQEIAMLELMFIECEFRGCESRAIINQLCVEPCGSTISSCLEHASLCSACILNGKIHHRLAYTCSNCKTACLNHSKPCDMCQEKTAKLEMYTCDHCGLESCWACRNRHHDLTIVPEVCSDDAHECPICENRKYLIPYFKCASSGCNDWACNTPACRFISKGSFPIASRQSTFGSYFDFSIAKKNCSPGSIPKGSPNYMHVCHIHVEQCISCNLSYPSPMKRTFNTKQNVVCCNDCYEKIILAIHMIGLVLRKISRLMPKDLTRKLISTFVNTRIGEYVK